jgi:hypothetical protein
MGSKAGRFRKLEVGDAPTSESCDAPDSSIAGPTESQILDEQELLEILDSDKSSVPVQSSDGGRDDKDEISLTDTFVPHGELTRKLDLLETMTQLQREAEISETIGATSGMKTYPFVKTHVSWSQRLLGWFRRD